MLRGPEALSCFTEKKVKGKTKFGTKLSLLSIANGKQGSCSWAVTSTHSSIYVRTIFFSTR